MLSEVYLEEINDHINNSTMHPLRRRMMKEMLAEIKALRRVAEAAEKKCNISAEYTLDTLKALEAWRKGGDC